MKGYSSDKVRNVVLLGHGGCGKTTLIEAALLATGVTSRLGRVEDGNTVSDYDKMEIEKKFSINTTLVPVEYKGYKYNFLDTPGYFDFQGEVISALSTAGAAIIVVDASEGVQVGTEKAWEMCRKYHTPKFMVLNKMDKSDADADKVVEQIRQVFGNSVVTDDDQDALNEAVAGASEELMEKFFNDEPFTEEEFTNGLKNGIATGDIVPIIKCSALKGGDGIDEILRCISKYVPDPEDHDPHPAVNNAGEDIEIATDVNQDPLLYVFKTIADPFLGKISYAKAITGTVKSGVEMYNPRTQKNEKLGSMFFVRGKTQEPATEVSAGDIVALAKLQNTRTGDTLSVKGTPVSYAKTDYSVPYTYMKYRVKNKGDEDKVSQALARMTAEDVTLRTVNDSENRQSLLYGMGEQHLEIVASKLASRYKVEITLETPKVAFRETIRKNSDVDSKYKKQSGGHGQYGHVKMKFEPSGDLETPFVFEECVVGGAVPKNYFPAVEKGLQESVGKGPLAGYPVVGVKAVLYDGSYHPVDSSEMAFKTATIQAFKKGFMEASPVLLEPIVSLKVTVPDDYTGDVMGDLNKRRGRVLGMTPVAGGKQVIEADIPMTGLFGYCTTLRSMTGGRGTYAYTFARYEQASSDVQEKEIAARAAEE